MNEVELLPELWADRWGRLFASAGGKDETTRKILSAQAEIYSICAMELSIALMKQAGGEGCQEKH